MTLIISHGTAIKTIAPQQACLLERFFNQIKITFYCKFSWQLTKIGAAYLNHLTIAKLPKPSLFLAIKLYQPVTTQLSNAADRSSSPSHHYGLDDILPIKDGRVSDGPSRDQPDFTPYA
ncbi:hypothetical protein, partial [Lactobacillus sp. MRS-253-APC-2B]|uniref:hypothetical protein n=1 Tax=Lactobacillus sp. MRS-253-APC-2B TaxID=2725305 RepID=UPI0019820D63